MAEVIYFDTYAGVASDPDVNAYSQTDLKDLTQAAIGTGAREALVWEPILILGVMIGIIASIFIGVLVKMRFFTKK